MNEKRFSLLAMLVACSCLLSMTSNAGAMPAPLGLRAHVVSISIIRRFVDAKTWSYSALVTVTDESGAPVPGATVSGNLSSCSRKGGTLAVSGITNDDGVAELGGESVGCQSICTMTFTVTGITITGTVYDPDANVVTSLTYTTGKGICPNVYEPCNPRSKICHSWKMVTAGKASPRAFSSSISISPNPLVDHTVIRFALPAGGRTVVSVWSMMGEELALLTDADLAGGDHAYVWTGTDNSGVRVAPGTYFFSIESGGEVETGTIIVAR